MLKAGSHPQVLVDLEDLYKDLHRHPDLSLRETRTAARAAEWLARAEFEVTTGVGGTGVVGALRNGAGPTVMLRADMDALPVREETGLAYQSTVTAVGADGRETGVMHACGHDMHVAWLAGAATVLGRSRGAWRGTILAVFQPAEETAAGARAMIDDGLLERFPKPDVILAQHLMQQPAGTVGIRSGVTTSAADSLRIRLFGRGAHGSMPETSIDPVVMAAATVMRLQTIVSRETAPSEFAVLTVAALQAGGKENVIPDEATIVLNVRTFNEAVRRRVLGAIERIVNAETQASGASRPAEIVPLNNYQPVFNDPAATARVLAALQGRLGADRVVGIRPLAASEDFGTFGSEWRVPSVLWIVGGADGETYRRAEAEGRLQELPINHNPRFAPVVHPTLETGVDTLVAAALAWLAL